MRAQLTQMAKAPKINYVSTINPLFQAKAAIDLSY